MAMEFSSDTGTYYDNSRPKRHDTSTEADSWDDNKFGTHDSSHRSYAEYHAARGKELGLQKDKAGNWGTYKDEYKNGRSTGIRYFEPHGGIAGPKVWAATRDARSQQKPAAPAAPAAPARSASKAAPGIDWTKGHEEFESYFPSKPAAAPAQQPKTSRLARFLHRGGHSGGKQWNK